MKRIKGDVLKSLVLSSLLAISAVTAVQAEAVQYGEGSTAQEDSVAVGNNATAQEGSVAIGNTAVADDRGIAIGNDVYTMPKDTRYSNIRLENISIGNRVQAIEGATNHGIGLGSDVTHGMNSVGIGNTVDARTMDSVVIGHNAKASLGREGIAIGLNTNTGLQSIALGTDATANSRSLALGMSTVANEVADGVALGSYSVVKRNGLIFEGTPAVTTSEAPTLGEFVAYHPKKVSTPVTTQVYASDKATDGDKTKVVATVKGSLSAISVGNDDQTRQIVNVAAGSVDTDAVNVAQLKSVDNRLTLVDGKVEALDGRVTTIESTIGGLVTNGNTNTTEISNIKTDVENQGKIIEEHTNQINDLDGRVTENANNISDLTDRVNNQGSAISGLSNRVDKLGTRVNKIGAGAAALAGLHPLDFDDDSKLTFAAGFGAYKNQQAAALGAFYRPNENLMFSFATAVGNSENMYNAGLSFRFGDSSPYQGLSKAELVSALEKQGADIDALKAKANEVDAVKAENVALNERLAKLEALLATR
ncbi:YadA-like family protein [uncultured Veillonella sp.]|uniref:YadA-like family protein n=1 Tax=uncultured Veillonella sp. TaxID=159268 RepID=UPI0025F6EBF2|nr:YadA-like family protein [uncultured Veillonella sp.]MDY3973251.1 YadA-like family protein [Veillonella caviae]